MRCRRSPTFGCLARPMLLAVSRSSPASCRDDGQGNSWRPAVLRGATGAVQSPAADRLAGSDSADRARQDRSRAAGGTRARRAAPEAPKLVCYSSGRSPAAAPKALNGRRGSLRGGLTRMNVWRPVELALAYGARAAWPAFQAVNRQFDGRTFQPKWAAAPLDETAERTRPQFGWPRTTDSLCPTCVREARARILSGEQSHRIARQRARRRDRGAHRRARRQES